MKNILLLTFFLTSLFAQYEIEGRWHLVGYENNVMYQFEDNYRYSIYSEDGNFGDIDDGGGTPNPYIILEDIITIDLFFGNIVSYQMIYRCDGHVVEFRFIEDGTIHSTLFQEGYNYIDNDCEECYNLSNIDFGECDMVLGVGWNGYECEYFSGCDWVIDDIDYSEYFFNSWQECEEICNNDNECNVTTDDILGPYYYEGAPYRSIISHENEPGQRLFISGTIKQNDCNNSISGSLIEIWQANDEGCYGIVENCDTGNPDNDYFNLRGKFFSDENGYYDFESILPGYYGSRPRHIHIKITTPNEEILVSQLYFENDPYCENDTWCQDAVDRIISLEENELGLNGEIDLIIDSFESGVILGDINFDISLTIQDIILLVGIILMDYEPNDFQIYAGDLNSNEIIDILDIIELVNIILD